MSPKNFNISTLFQPIQHYWRQRQLSQWHTSYYPRLVWPDDQQPTFVQQCPTSQLIIQQLRHLDWNQLPQPTGSFGFARQSVPLAAYIGSFLTKIIYQISNMAKLYQFLQNHPALIWSLGFPLVVDLNHPAGFSPHHSLPSQRQFSRVLTNLPNDILQDLLTAQVRHLQQILPATFGQTISLDTKHILAWTKENNPRQYIKEGRFDKTQQPSGDPDCKLGCKRRHNRLVTTPSTEGKPASTTSIKVGEFYWGYASGAVVTKLPGWGEFVLAEMTQTFDKSDVSYFFPLMAQVENRLGFRPRYGALDAGFDAFYIYDYFHSPDHDGFAAVPFCEKGGKPDRQFDATGLPLCDAGLAMPLKFTYQDRKTAIIPYTRARHSCPLLYPEPTGEICPINHKRWPKGGCNTNLAATAGSRLRHQLDRESPAYKEVYKQRTAVERIYSQAKDLGIERPKLRNQAAITNQNTLIYLVVNLYALERVLQRQKETLS